MTADALGVRRPRYGTWIRARRLYLFAGLTALCVAGSLLGVRWAWFWLLLLPGLLLGYISMVLGLTTYRFTRGGYQRRIHELLAGEIAGLGGAVLDVGCGSGSLAVIVAKADPDCVVLGVDLWADDWEYSQSQCERNARAEGVADRVRFQRASAADLPFVDASVDAVISCLTFHEVRECVDRTEPVAEALRVLRPGGRFAFLDLFSDPASFTSPSHVREAVSRSGCAISRDEPLAAILPLPYPLSGPRVLGHARVMTGIRSPVSAD